MDLQVLLWNLKFLHLTKKKKIKFGYFYISCHNVQPPLSDRNAVGVGVRVVILDSQVSWKQDVKICGSALIYSQQIIHLKTNKNMKKRPSRKCLMDTKTVKLSY